jgi:hypothetical protein
MSNHKPGILNNTLECFLNYLFLELHISISIWIMYFFSFISVFLFELCTFRASYLVFLFELFIFWASYPSFYLNYVLLELHISISIWIMYFLSFISLFLFELCIFWASYLYFYLNYVFLGHWYRLILSMQEMYP